MLNNLLRIIPSKYFLNIRKKQMCSKYVFSFLKNTNCFFWVFIRKTTQERFYSINKLLRGFIQNWLLVFLGRPLEFSGKPNFSSEYAFQRTQGAQNNEHASLNKTGNEWLKFWWSDKDLYFVDLLINVLSRDVDWKDSFECRKFAGEDRGRKAATSVWSSRCYGSHCRRNHRIGNFCFSKGFKNYLYFTEKS